MFYNDLFQPMVLLTFWISLALVTKPEISLVVSIEHIRVQSGIIRAGQTGIDELEAFLSN